MIRFFIENITLHAPYNRENIQRILQEGIKHKFKYVDYKKSLLARKLVCISFEQTLERATKMPYDKVFEKPSALSIDVKTPDSEMAIWFREKNGLLYLSISQSEESQFFEDEWAIYPDSHYYLREALKLCAPFCIKSIETTTMQ